MWETKLAATQIPRCSWHWEKAVYVGQCVRGKLVKDSVCWEESWRNSFVCCYGCLGEVFSKAVGEEGDNLPLRVVGDEWSWALCGREFEDAACRVCVLGAGGVECVNDA